MQRILDAAVSILVSEGIQSLNTNRVADEAGVNVATVYSYFRDKNDIVRSLAEQFESVRAGYVEEQAADLGATDDWAGWIVDIIDRMAWFRLESPGGLAIRHALLSAPELRGLDEESTQRAIDAQIPGIRAQARRMPARRLRTVVRVMVETITSGLDAAFRTTPHDQELLEEVKFMVIGYLARYMKTPPKQYRPDER